VVDKGTLNIKRVVYIYKNNYKSVFYTYRTGTFIYFIKIQINYITTKNCNITKLIEHKQNITNRLLGSINTNKYEAYIMLRSRRSRVEKKSIIVRVIKSGKQEERGIALHRLKSTYIIYVAINR